jgi:hypothetical protein
MAPGAAGGEGLDLVAALPELRLAESSFCQWGRLALAPEYRTPEALRGYCSAMIEVSRALGYHYDVVRGLRIPAEAGFDGLPHLLGVGHHDAACGSGNAHPPLQAVA